MSRSWIPILLQLPELHGPADDLNISIALLQIPRSGETGICGLFFYGKSIQFP